jgi:hypothetical protein
MHAARLQSVLYPANTSREPYCSGLVRLWEPTSASILDRVLVVFIGWIDLKGLENGIERFDETGPVIFAPTTHLMRPEEK